MGSLIEVDRSSSSWSRARERVAIGTNYGLTSATVYT